MHAAIRQSEWDECPVRYDHGPTLRYVYRRAPGERCFAPWLVVAPSALLRSIGACGEGLYAARGLHEGQSAHCAPSHGAPPAVVHIRGRRRGLA